MINMQYQYNISEYMTILHATKTTVNVYIRSSTTTKTFVHNTFILIDFFFWRIQFSNRPDKWQMIVFSDIFQMISSNIDWYCCLLKKISNIFVHPECNHIKKNLFNYSNQQISFENLFWFFTLLVSISHGRISFSDLLNRHI